MTAPTTLPTTYLVVGGGPFGLIAARALQRKGIDFEIIERHTELGGIWDMTDPGSPMYETCHFITSKQLGGYIDYPMPAEYPTYPSKAEPVGEHDETTWNVTTSDGETRSYRGILAACGQQWWPYAPTIPGAEDFGGEIYHSSEYRSPEQFVGKKVLVIGAGNSGVDIAVDAAERAGRAIISTRRDYYWFPKQLFGLPTVRSRFGEHVGSNLGGV